MALLRLCSWVFIAAAVAALACGNLAHAQSFDCGRARYLDEKTVCRDPALRQLDNQLAYVYRRLMLKLSPHARAQLDQQEESFVIRRRGCAENRACIEQSYRTRIDDLEQALSRETEWTN